MSFPIADSWVFVYVILAAFYAIQKHSRVALFASLAGASLIFLGLYAFTYGYNTGLFFILTTNEIFEIAIKIYCLTIGSLLIYHGWKSNAPELVKDY